jgi:hypothetical protein
LREKEKWQSSSCHERISTRLFDTQHDEMMCPWAVFEINDNLLGDCNEVSCYQRLVQMLCSKASSPGKQGSAEAQKLFLGCDFDVVWLLQCIQSGSSG